MEKCRCWKPHPVSGVERPISIEEKLIEHFLSTLPGYPQIPASEITGDRVTSQVMDPALDRIKGKCWSYYYQSITNYLGLDNHYHLLPKLSHYCINERMTRTRLFPCLRTITNNVNLKIVQKVAKYKMWTVGKTGICSTPPPHRSNRLVYKLK